MIVVGEFNNESVFVCFYDFPKNTLYYAHTNDKLTNIVKKYEPSFVIQEPITHYVQWSSFVFHQSYRKKDDELKAKIILDITGVDVLSFRNCITIRCVMSYIDEMIGKLK